MSRNKHTVCKAGAAGGWWCGHDAACGPNAASFRFIRDADGIVAYVEGSRDVAMKRAARIVECVNACEGIANPGALVPTLRQSHAPAHDTMAKAAAEAAILADTAPAHAREFWRRLAGSLRKAATIPR